MKKSLSIVLVLLLLLTACQALPDDDQSLASTPSSSGSITPPPSSSVVPTTQPTVPPTTQPTMPPTTQPTTPTTQPTTPGTDQNGFPTIYNPEIDSQWSKQYDFSGCTGGYLYWVNEDTKKVTLLLAEQLSNQLTEGEYVYFVKKAERNKIYRMHIAEPEQYELLYETAYETVGNMSIVPHLENYLQFTADSEKFVIYDLNTGKETVLLEVHHMHVGLITAKENEDGVLGEWISFYGQPTKESPYGSYMYNRITGEFEVDDSL